MRARLPVGAMRTYQILAPLSTHWRPATCGEVQCPHHLNGWATTVLVDSADEGAVRASGRKWTAVETLEGGFRRYVFPPGQACFKASAHRIKVDRPEIYVVRDGDRRGNPTGYVRRHTDATQWVEDFAENQQNLAYMSQKG